MIKIKRECTGCMACVNRCPAGAIEITEDEYGFVMPHINTDRCTSCGLCEKICPIWEERRKTFPLAALSAYHKDAEIVRISSSGGVYHALGEIICEAGGIAFGCYYDIKKKRAYLADTDHLPLEALLTSKYVESEIGATGFRRVEDEAKKGRSVLFCGTPCQAAGLKRYLGRDYENLLIVDFACGGVAAQPYLSDYLERLEQEHGAKLSRMSFRDKHYGWGQYCFYAEFENGAVYRKTAMADPYFFCFLRSSMQRLSCHDCRFSDGHVSDLTLSDFWKCDHFEIEKNDRKGLSLILIFSEKGRRITESLSDRLHMEALPLKEASYHLAERHLREEKMPEIRADMKTARNEGVEALRNRLLSEEQRAYYDERQRIMDDETESKMHPDIVGKGQLV